MSATTGEIESLLDAPALDVAAAVRRRRASAAALTEAVLARIAARNPELGAFTEVTEARARAAAIRIDARIAGGDDPGPLAGVPFAAKNLYDLIGVVTRAGSRIQRSCPPAGCDATAVSRLEAAGAICFGALNMGEYAYDFTGENMHDGPSRNPHDTARLTGGSSGGSASAVASGMLSLALGTDTNGSIRVPAAFCGLFGLKPSFGRLSRAGVFPFVSSLDHVGPIGRSVADLAAAHDAMRGPDPSDPACAVMPVPELLPELSQGVAGLRIAELSGYFAEGAEPDALAAVGSVARALGVTHSVEYPEAAAARAAAFLITMAEGGALHLKRLRLRMAEFDPAVRDRLIAGAMLPAAWIQQAQIARRLALESARKLFAKADVLLAPTVPCAVPEAGATMLRLDGTEIPLRVLLGRFTQPLSCIGLPVVAVPVWPDGGGLPLSVQIIAAPGRDDHAMRVAYALQEMGVAHAPVAAAGPAGG